MISMSELSDAWKEIIPQAGQSVGRRADKNHPLDFSSLMMKTEICR